MSKETYYFSHDYEPTSDPKIQALIGEYGAIGYGIYWRIVEMLHAEESHKLPKKPFIYSAIAKQMLTSVEQLQTIITYMIEVCELFENDEKHFYSNRVMRNVNKLESIRLSRSEAGRKSAEIRRNLTSVEQTLTGVQQNSTKESKVKKSKVKEIKEINIGFDVFWELYDRKKDRINCEAKWQRLTDDERQKIIDILPAYLSQITDKQYQPYPQTFLNGRRWEDEITVKPKQADKKFYIGTGMANDAWFTDEEYQNHPNKRMYRLK